MVSLTVYKESRGLSRLLPHYRVEYHKPETGMLGESTRLVLRQISDVVRVRDVPYTGQQKSRTPFGNRVGKASDKSGCEALNSGIGVDRKAGIVSLA